MEKHIIEICMGSSCFARGNDRNLEVIESFLKRKDLKIEVLLRGSRCNGCCSQGPNVTIDGILYREVSPDGLTGLLNELFP
jgi:NADH:ubiquinone oxidoreductase subunit E